MILLETINVTFFSRTSVCLASKPSCRDVTDHKARGRGKFCIKLRNWFTSLRHKTTFSLKSQHNCMYFLKIMKQKKQNLGFLNYFFVITNGTWRCIKRTHVAIPCAILFASQPVPRSWYYVMFLSMRRKRKTKKPISELFLTSLLKKLCREFEQNLNKILTLSRNCDQIEWNKNIGVIAKNIIEKKELTSNTQRTQQRLSGQT